MALIKCIECGKEISSRAACCPNCGCPVEKKETAKENKDLFNEIENLTENSETDSIKAKTDNKDKVKEKEMLSDLKKICKIFLMAAMIIFMLAVINDLFSGNNKKETDVKEETPAVEIFQIDLINNWEQYIGKKVMIAGTYDYYNSSDKLLELDYYSEYGQHHSDQLKCEINSFNKDSNKTGDYFLVSGIVKEEKYKLSDCRIVEKGFAAKEVLDSEIADYEIKLAEIEMKNEEEFRNSDLSSPTYEELLRYPDTYKTTKIKVTVYISEKEADGLILEGTIWGTYQGQEVVVKDDRKVKEPEILTGDTLIIYGYGDGTAVKKTYKKGTGFLGSDLGAEVVKEETIPKISIIYCDFK